MPNCLVAVQGAKDFKQERTHWGNEPVVVVETRTHVWRSHRMILLLDPTFGFDTMLQCLSLGAFGLQGLGGMLGPVLHPKTLEPIGTPKIQ